MVDVDEQDSPQVVASFLPSVAYDRKWGLAIFWGPGGFTQTHMPEIQAEAIAAVYQIPFEVERYGTTQ